MRRGGYGKERSDQPGKKDVPITPVIRVLHPVTRSVIGGAFMGGGVASLFLWDLRYAVAAVIVMAGCLIVGPWVWPHEKLRIEVDPNYRPDLGDTGTHNGPTL
jgi:alpha-beta hydrolase superfamily lysophospholipase